MKKMIKVFRGTLAISLSFLLSTQALAASISWDLVEDGTLHITTSGDTYEVTGGTAENPTSNTIIVDEYVEATINLNGVNIAATDESAINVGEYSEVTLNVNGENTVTSDSKAAIHVTDGDLSITSEVGGVLNASNMGTLDEEGYSINYTESAAIGSNEGEDMDGSITISGNVTVNAESNNDGAAVGSGQAKYEYIEENQVDTYTGGTMSGTITLQDDAVVDTYSGSDGAGIGSGMNGDMSGTIIIQDNATVNAFSEDDGAGIGSGDNGDMDGSITIAGGTITAIGDDQGAGIGSGEGGYMMGEITISGGTVIALSEDDGAGIGAGEGEVGYYYDEEGNEHEYPVGGDMTGTITISGGDVTAVGEDRGAGIGAGENGDLRGEILISGGTVNASSSEGAGIGSGMGGDMNGTISISGGAEVTVESEYAVGIGSGEGGALGKKAEYVIGTGTTINGVSGSDIEAQKEIIQFELDENGNPVNVTVKQEETPKPKPEHGPAFEGVYAHTLIVESKKISVVILSDLGPTKLNEAEVEEEIAVKLTAGVEDEDVLMLIDLSFDKEYDGNFTLWFHLGKEFAGKQVELRWLEDDELVTKTVTVNAAGNAGLVCKQLGSFAVIAK